MALTPLSVKKKCSDYRIHGIQIDRLGLTVSTQKSVLKNMHRVPRYYQKDVKNRPSQPNQQNLTHFGQYLRTRCIFFKTDFCVDLNTVNPITIIGAIFFSHTKGSDIFLKLRSPKLNPLKNEKKKFFLFFI